MTMSPTNFVNYSECRITVAALINPSICQWGYCNGVRYLWFTDSIGSSCKISPRLQVMLLIFNASSGQVV